MNSNSRNSDRRTQIRKITFSALFLALALVLPFVTGQIPEVGRFISPMHIPAFLCGFICGPLWGAVVGFTAPLLRFVLFSMPDLMTAIPMAFELASYAVLSALLYRLAVSYIGNRWLRCALPLALSMVGGRIVYSAVKIAVLGIGGESVSAAAYIAVFAQSFAGTWFGIILQICLIPPIVYALELYLEKNKKA